MSTNILPTENYIVIDDDCEIMYENVANRSYLRTEDLSGIDVKNCNGCCNAVDCYCHCSYKLATSEYPNYVADELALFAQLQSGSKESPENTKMEVPLEEIIDLEIDILSDDDSVTSVYPEKDSDEMDCEIVYSERKNSFDPGAEKLAKELDLENDSAVHWQSTLNNCGLPNNLITKSMSDPMTLSASRYDVAKNSEHVNEKPAGMVGISADPRKIVDSGRQNSPDPGTEKLAEKLDIVNDSAVHSQDTLKNYDLRNKQRKKSMSDPPEYVNEKQDGRVEYAGIDDPSKCQICETVLPSISAMKYHLLDHIEITKSNAQIYENSIKALKKLDRRMKKSRSRRSSVCSICWYVFSCRADLWHHAYTVHANMRPYQCKICPKNYKTQYHLTRHEATHSRNL